MTLAPRRRARILLCSFAVVACGDSSSSGSQGPDVVLSAGDSVGPTTTGTDGSGDAPTGGDPDASTTVASTTATTTDPAASSTGEPAGFCGDGVVAPGEECDDAAANSDNGFCTTQCRLNYCGDGNVFLGFEVCDEGAANSDGYGSLCNTACAPGLRCGDHLVQPEHGEECDLGPDNGSGRADEQGVACEAFCKSHALRAFVTGAAFTGALGGIAGADAKCRAAASAAGLGEPQRFHAYLSTPESPTNDRFPGPNAEALPYILVTGKKLADSHAKLLEQGPLGEGLSVTEFGESLYDERVATNTTPGGESYSPDQHCLSWTSADPLQKARAGATFPSGPADYQAWLLNGEWVGKMTLKCSQALLHLYCLEI